MVEFAKGLNVKTIKKDDWEIIKVGVNCEEFKQNPVKNGWVNIVFKRSKQGDWYPAIDDWKPKEV